MLAEFGRVKPVQIIKILQEPFASLNVGSFDRHLTDINLLKSERLQKFTLSFIT